MRFFDLISQSLILNIRFLNKFVIWIFDVFATMHETALLHPNDRGNFLNFFSELEETIMMSLITKEKYMSYNSVFRYDPSKFEIEPCCYL